MVEKQIMNDYTSREWTELLTNIKCCIDKLELSTHMEHNSKYYTERSDYRTQPLSEDKVTLNSTSSGKPAARN